MQLLSVIALKKNNFQTREKGFANVDRLGEEPIFFFRCPDNFLASALFQTCWHAAKIFGIKLSGIGQ
jgi:hypothetical protein